MDPTQPGGDAPAPVTPPAEPAAPAPAPAEPAVPAPTGTPATPPPVDPAADADTQEWEDAEKEIFPGIKTKQEPKKDEPAKPAEAPKAPEAPAAGKDGEQPPKPADEGDPKDDEQDEGASPEFDNSAYDARRAQREAQANKDAVVADVKKQLYPDLPQELRDADGDPIKSIDDVMKLVNPRTQKPFTEEEAGQWLLAAQQQFNQRIADINTQIEQVADIYIDLKDQADAINYRYGELLKVLPDPRDPKKLLKDTLWARYQDTLVKDEKSGIITKAPVNLEEFYETILEPYARLAAEEAGGTPPVADPAAPAGETPEQKTAREAKEKQDAEDKKKRNLQDRSDIYGGGSKDDPDPEAKEWADAENEVFGDELARRNQKK